MQYIRAFSMIGALMLCSGLADGASAQDEWSNRVPHQALAEGWTNPFPQAIFPVGTLLEQANARTVVEFYDRMINAKDVAAASELIGPDYDQHLLEFGNGREGLAAYVADLAARLPGASVDVKRIVPDGEYVFLHSHFKEDAGDLGSIAGDMFRLENGRIVERWSVLHPIPEDPSPENPNGVFGGADDGSRRN